jgi:predicted phosphate transport protein (TIGR00153 family)
LALFKKQEKVEQMLERYFDRCDACYEQLEVAFQSFFENGTGADFDEKVNGIHERESQADDLRRDIELTLYGKALLPESRGDLLGLLESFDGLPNIAETIGFVVSSDGI